MKWFPDNGTPEKEREREDAAEQAAEEMSGQRQRKDGRAYDADLHFSD